VLGIVGLLGALGGAALYLAVDRQRIATLVREGEFRFDVFTEEEAIDALVALGEWGGIGLAAAGVSIVLIGIAVVVTHERARHDGRGTPRWILGVVGAIINVVFGFVPFSPILGGAAASHLSSDFRGNGIATGTFAGLFTILPAFVGFSSVSVGLFTGLPGGTAAVAVALLVIAGMFAMAYIVGLSALGGYLGSRI